MRICTNKTIVTSQINHHMIRWIGWQQRCKHVSRIRLLPQASVALASAAEYCSQTSLASVTSTSDRLVGYIRLWSLLRSIIVNCSSPLEPAGLRNVQNWSKVSCSYLTKRCKLGTWLGFIETALSKQFLASVRFSRTSKMRPRYNQNKKEKKFSGAVKYSQGLNTGW